MVQLNRSGPGEGAPSAASDWSNHLVNECAVGKCAPLERMVELSARLVDSQLNRSGPGEGGAADLTVFKFNCLIQWQSQRSCPVGRSSRRPKLGKNEGF